ncbi:hypothetical protein A3K24_00090 [candidate division Kazan bacterium RIFCSPHIGHO2_01_FULL_44_14]|uniref:Sodium/calcium exchanger membrane region domain-containing protein n=1 Tax=candidate division Kazan bacterium RIFCSPLOWO2_01_FULL_45_19 TaxID=1798538 RepID=A0A1F4NPS3_UNCK3|nr:MAG: hypothetical protein A3K51_00090 [candidate division Kazan bacterium RIFCSPLOWO2_01_FULL_45_19]OGB77512.1 MAG: hypothetical protein A3K24_00090 [candidate division Kazan bacterium RIFCSPHIGHO2_01_FULL_44_14]
MLITHILLLLGLSCALGLAAKFATKSAHRIAKYFHTNDFVIGFFVVGVATSTPEITVAIDSALQHAPGLSLGNLLGASIVILSLLAGLAAILSGKLSINRFLRNDDFLMYLIISALPVVAIFDGQLTRLDGLWLIGAYLLFIGRMYQRRNIYEKHLALPSPNHRNSHLVIEILKLLLSLVAILVLAHYLVNSSLVVASTLSVSPLLIGLLILSIGTNLPEVTLVLTQSRKQSHNLILGDLLGNVLLNVPTLGLLALISPFAIAAPVSTNISAIFLLVSVALFGILMWSKNMLTRREGILLFIVYAVYAIHNLSTITT